VSFSLIWNCLMISVLETDMVFFCCAWLGDFVTRRGRAARFDAGGTV
jgi:hypothetical protein